MNEVVFVGTSDAFGAGGRRQSAAVLRTGSGSILMDCGATTNSGLNSLEISRNEIDVILVSHFHGDHFAGIPLFLLASIYEDHRSRALEIAGPPEIEERVRSLAAAMGHELDHHEAPFPIRFTEVTPGRDYEIGPATIRSFETRHQIEAHPHGYDIRSGGQRVVYSGDTGWFDELPSLVSNADLFVCECTYHVRDLDFHLNYELLSERRDRFDCGRMILTHLGEEMIPYRGKSEIETADDGLAIKL